MLAFQTLGIAHMDLGGAGFIQSDLRLCAEKNLCFLAQKTKVLMRVRRDRRP